MNSEFADTAFGQTLQRLRTARSVSQSKLAGLARFDHSYVSRLESGERMPAREAVDRIANALNCDNADRDALLATAGFLPVHINLTPSCPAAWALDDLHRVASPETQRHIEAGLSVLLWAARGQTSPPSAGDEREGATTHE